MSFCCTCHKIVVHFRICRLHVTALVIPRNPYQSFVGITLPSPPGHTLVDMIELESLSMGRNLILSGCQFVKWLRLRTLWRIAPKCGSGSHFQFLDSLSSKITLQINKNSIVEIVFQSKLVNSNRNWNWEPNNFSQSVNKSVTNWINRLLNAPHTSYD